MEVLFIANGITSESDADGKTQVIGGGEVRFIEIAKRWKKRGVDISIITTEAGLDLCKRLGLEANFYISSRGTGSIVEYTRVFLASSVFSRLVRDFKGILYSTTEHFYDCAPAYRLRNRSKLWAAVVHWIAPLNRKEAGFISSSVFYINQRLGFRLIKSRADLLLAVSPVVAARLRSMKFREVRSVECGVDYERIREIAGKRMEKKYDSIYMKRFYPTKGIFDTIEIWKRVVEEKREAKLLLVGFSPKPILRRIMSIIRENSLEDNIKVMKPVYDFTRKVSLLCQSKMLILPSYEENWAIVIGEALACGIPVIAYDLPDIRPIWKDKVIWVPLGDIRAFSKEVLKLIEKEDLRRERGNKGVEFMKKYSWNEIADRELRLIQGYIRTSDS